MTQRQQGAKRRKQARKQYLKQLAICLLPRTATYKELDVNVTTSAELIA